MNDSKALPGAMAAELRALVTNPTDEDVVTSARNGEIWAFEVLYRRHAASAFAFARRLLGNDEDVDDVVQDAFVMAFAKIASLREAAAFRSWLHRIALGRISRVIRKRRVLASLGLRRRELANIDELFAPSAPADVVLELRRLYARIDGLPTHERVAIVLRRVEGASLEEIAELTGCSLATVKRRLSRAEEALARGGKP